MSMTEFAEPLQRIAFSLVGFPIHFQVTATGSPFDAHAVAAGESECCFQESVEDNEEENQEEREEQDPEVGVDHCIFI